MNWDEGIFKSSMNEMIKKIIQYKNVGLQGDIREKDKGTMWGILQTVIETKV